jgi:hypothetical protein
VYSTGHSGADIDWLRNLTAIGARFLCITQPVAGKHASEISVTFTAGWSFIPFRQHSSRGAKPGLKHPENGSMLAPHNQEQLTETVLFANIAHASYKLE